MTCHTCGAAMVLDTSRHHFVCPGYTVIDGCAHCNVLWLDFPEVRQIIDAPARDRGRSAQ